LILELECFDDVQLPRKNVNILRILDKNNFICRKYCKIVFELLFVLYLLATGNGAKLGAYAETFREGGGLNFFLYGWENLGWNFFFLKKP